jgi:hypothetical protein
VINVSTVADTLILTDTGSVLTLCSPVDVEEIKNEKSEMEIYPNPNNGTFSLTSLFYPI